MAAKIVSRRIDFRTIFSAGRYFFILNILCTMKQMRSSAKFLTPISKLQIPIQTDLRSKQSWFWEGLTIDMDGKRLHNFNKVTRQSDLGVNFAPGPSGEASSKRLKVINKHKEFSRVTK